ncbi:MAG: hypothetical protein ACOC2B_08080 [Sediminispirochaetaceae bacterium]
MLWQRVNSTISKTLGHFVLENERFNISLVSRLREKKNSLLPFSDNSILYVGYPRSSRHNSVPIPGKSLFRRILDLLRW